MAARKQKQISKPARDKAVASPEAAKVSDPIVKKTELEVKAVASVRVLHDGRAIVAVDGDMETIPCKKATIIIED